MKHKEKNNQEELNQNTESQGSINPADTENNSDKNNELIEQLQKQVQEYKDRFLRKAAEFENYKRRTENDQLNLLKYAAENFIVRLLPVVDDFERSLKHIDSPAAKNDIAAVKEGIRLVYDKFMKIFEDQGVTKINAVGKPFDVHYHEAVMQRKAAGTEPHTVLDEVETGYLYKDRVIRHSKVVVSEDIPEESNTEESAGSEGSSKGEEN